MVTRRDFLGTSLAALPLAASWPAAALSRHRSINYGPELRFDFQTLMDRAQTLARSAFQPAAAPFAKELDAIDYDAFQKIVFRREFGIGRARDANYNAQLFHQGRYFKEPVEIHLVENGNAREVLYSPEYFSFGEPGLVNRLPRDLGFAGFRLQDKPLGNTDWLAFLGGCYFRSSGELNQYGLSARAVAVDTALPSGEEFPRFVGFWLEPGKANDEDYVIYALLDGPSVTGAFKFVCRKATQVTMDVTARFFARQDIKRFGVGALTSMFWFGENNRAQAADWRPEIHDSDGLALWTGAGERLWRPLNNPPKVMTNSFVDEDPKGFGLMQRDRAFSNYEDDSVFYDRRPSVWVEPMGPWGKGSVQLVEIPTDDEIYDNIVAYWVPAKAVSAGDAVSFDYRLHWNRWAPGWGDGEPARAMHTRVGIGGVPGQPRPKGVRKFVIDFAGGPLASLPKSADVSVVATASRGTISNVYTLQVVGTKTWRAFLDLDAQATEDPVDLRCYLKLGERALTETWLYQYFLPKDVRAL